MALLVNSCRTRP